MEWIRRLFLPLGVILLPGCVLLGDRILVHHEAAARRLCGLRENDETGPGRGRSGKR